MARYVKYLSTEFEGDLTHTYYEVTFPGRKYGGVRNFFRGRTLTVRRTYDTRDGFTTMFCGPIELNGFEYGWVKEMSRPGIPGIESRV